MYTGKHDVIMTSQLRIFFRSVMAEGGFRTMFRGFSAVMIRAFPANAACFLAMEYAMRGLNMLW